MAPGTSTAQPVAAAPVAAAPAVALGDAAQGVAESALATSSTAAGHRAPGGGDVLSAADVAALRARLAGAAIPTDQTARVDLLRALEELTATVSAVQATVALAFDTAERQREASAGVPAASRGQAVPAQVGLAMRQSPARARSFLGAARVWHTEMPFTFAALRSGRLSAWRATVLVKETAHLPLEARAVVDREVCADPVVTEGMGTAGLTARVRKRAAELDPAAAVERARRAERERSVWIRPAPDTMSYVTALLPVAQGVAVYAGLRRAADSATAQGDERSRGQVMADTLVERVTGQGAAGDVPVMVNLVVSDATLLGAGHEPAVLTTESGPGGGVVPAQVARNLVGHGLDAGVAWLRRLYADPGGNLVAASSASRFFGDGLAAMLRARDQGICRTPFCDAPVRHLDHVVPAGHDGRTSLVNGQGTCAACNQAKNAGVLRQRVQRETPRHTVVTTTSTGHVYTSTAPAPPRPASPPGPTAPPAATPESGRRRVRAPARRSRSRHGPRRGAQRPRVVSVVEQLLATHLAGPAPGR